ncbi:MAG: DJ-1/PfpI family protein [Proteobacteria bacterium]|nr:DJ-1/PfpI family protein [Pseudomonadota bacterium]
MKNLFSIALALYSFGTMAQESVFSKLDPKDIPAGLEYHANQPPVGDPQQFKGKRIAILAAHGVQESELVFPYEFLKARGATIDIVSPAWTDGRVVMVQYLKPIQWVNSTESFQSAALRNYDLMVLTGGAWNSTVVRSDTDALILIRNHFAKGKALAAICSGAQILIDSGIAKDRNLTGTHSVKVDLINAGATYLDKPVVVDDQLITSRNPDDLIPFVEAIAEILN